MKYRDRLFTKSPNRDRQKNRLRNTAITFSPKELNRDRETNTLRNTAIAFSPKELNRDRRKRRYEIPRSLFHQKS
jgi:hypothetical protein